MKKRSILYSILLIVAFTSMVMAQTVNVTFRVNSSTVYRITDSLSVVDLRGTVTQWGPGTDMENKGGDYWEVTIPLDANTSYEYKYGARDTTTIQVDEWWENDIPGANYQGGNRLLQTGSSDTVLALDYLGSGPDNNVPPYTPSDSIDVYFRVNMSELVLKGGFDSDVNATKLSIVGAFPGPDGADNMWSPGKYQLKREGGSDYWSYHLKLDPAKAPFDSTMYRFHNNGTDWGSNDGVQSENIRHGMFPNSENRGTSVFLNDTTISWKWWNDDAPGLAGNDTVDVRFRADLTQAIEENGFNIGDTLLVKWGYNNTATFGTDTLSNEFGTNFYSVTTAVENIALDSDVQYQYHKILNGSDREEIFFDFFETAGGSNQKSRKVYIPAVPSEPVLVEDIIADDLTSLHRRPRFINGEKLSQPVLVTFSVDIRPAYYTLLKGVTIHGIQDSPDITEADTVVAWGAVINGPATSGWAASWGSQLLVDPDRMMYDDGTNGDMTAGDTIWTKQILFSPDSSSRNTIGTEFKFGIGGEDNEAGSEQGFGLNHFENIDDSQSEFTIHTDFGSINPDYYVGWDFDNGVPIVSAIGDEMTNVIRSSRLLGNYPNPFNPTTKIRFELQKRMDVKLAIFDVTGRAVRTLLNGPQNKGGHVVYWNGNNDRGVPVSTGVYFYRLEAGDYVKTMKMLLLK